MLKRFRALSARRSNVTKGCSIDALLRTHSLGGIDECPFGFFGEFWLRFAEYAESTTRVAVEFSALRFGAG
jgi:hypothetical protein